jgi:site-specific DNA recombinase
MNKPNKRPNEAKVLPINKQLPEIRYCLYARKSMEPDDRQAMSIDSQTKEMQAIAERDKLYVACIKTEAHSAKNSGERNVFNEIINDIKFGRYNAILTWNPDRLSRNAGDLGKLVDLMDDHKLIEVRTYGQVFTNSPNDKFLMMILGSQAKLENDNRSVNVKRGLRMIVGMGLWPGMAPIGYLNTNRKDQAGQLFIDPERAPIVKEIFDKVAYHAWTVRQVTRWLRESNFRTINNKLISLSTVQNILKRPIYYGWFEWPKGSGQWVKGQNEPLITKETFDRVKDQIMPRSPVKFSHSNSFAYVRLLRCGVCGCGITANEKFKKIKDGSIVRYAYYLCTRGRGDLKCSSPWITELELTNELIGILDKVELDEIGIRAKLEAEIDRFYDFHAFVTGEVFDRPPEKRAVDLRNYAKKILEDGTVEDKRQILRCLKSRLIIKDKKVYLDGVDNP